MQVRVLRNYVLLLLDILKVQDGNIIEPCKCLEVVSDQRAVSLPTDIWSMFHITHT